MKISLGDRLPNASLCRIGSEGPETVELNDLTKGRSVVLFAVPGAFTPTCSGQHVPSFINNADSLRKHGVDDIICIAVNDPFVLKAWEEETGAGVAGVTVFGDSDAQFTKAVGMELSVPPAGLYDRSQRYSMHIVDGIVKSLNIEESPGVCKITSGDEMLIQLANIN